MIFFFPTGDIFFPSHIQESFLHGAGVVATPGRSLLSEAKGLVTETAQTTNGISAASDSVSISHPSQSLQSTCRNTLLSVQLPCGPQLWRGGHGNVMVLMSGKDMPKLKDWICRHKKDHKGLRSTWSWSVWQGMLVIHEYCAFLKSWCNTRFTLKSSVEVFWLLTVCEI